MINGCPSKWYVASWLFLEIMLKLSRTIHTIIDTQNGQHEPSDTLLDIPLTFLYYSATVQRATYLLIPSLESDFGLAVIRSA